MSKAELTEQQLLNEAQAAFREDGKERAMPFLAEFYRRSGREVSRPLRRLRMSEIGWEAERRLSSPKA